MEDFEDWGFVVINFLIVLFHILEFSAIAVGVIAIGISIAYCANALLEIVAHRKRLKIKRKASLKSLGKL